MAFISEIILNLPLVMIIGLNILIFITAIRHRKIVRVDRIPKVSIIVTAWNEGKRIERCINSLANLDYPKTNKEIIIVGGGTDNTGKICKKLAKKES